MSLLLYIGALGVIIGYFTAGQIVSSNRTWKWAYYTQMFATLLICLALMPISIRSLDLKIVELVVATEAEPKSKSTPLLQIEKETETSA